MTDSLADAQRRVEDLVAVYNEEQGHVPSWLFALHETVVRANKQQQADSQEGTA